MKDVLAWIVKIGCLIVIPMSLVVLIGPFPTVLLGLSIPWVVFMLNKPWKP